MPWPPVIGVRSFEPKDKIRALMPAYRAGADALRGLRQANLNPRDKLALLAFVSIGAAQQRRIFRRYLLRRFHYDPLQFHDSSGIEQVKAAIAARGSYQFIYFMDAMNTFAAYHRLFVLPNRAGEEAQASGATLDAAVNIAWDVLMAEYERGPAAASRAAQIPAGDDAVFERLLAVSAFAATNFSLGRNRRLRSALSRPGATPFERLLEELPAAAMLATSEITSASTSKDLLHKLAHVLEQTAPAGRPGGGIDVVGIPEAAADTFTLAEEARRELISELLDHAHLAPQELLVFDLDFGGVPQADIAARLGLALGTVKATKHRAMNKLKAAAANRRQDFFEVM